MPDSVSWDAWLAMLAFLKANQQEAHNEEEGDFCKLWPEQD